MNCSVLHCCYRPHHERIVSRLEGGYDVRTSHWYCDRHAEQYPAQDLRVKEVTHA